jgi:transposase
MKATLSSQATDWGEGRRLRAWELHQQGWSQQRIAAALGVTQSAVSKWLARAHIGGISALKRRKAPGRAASLSAEQRARLPELLAQGAEAFGFRGAIWTCPRVAEVIKRSFGITYHPAHISRILKAIGWSLQQPIRRARQRDEPAIQHWREHDAPALKKRLNSTSSAP